MAELTPSEVVLLHGERFAKKRRFGNVRLLHTERKVAADQLAEAILLAAFVSNGEERAIRFEPGETPRLFGLRTRRALFLEPEREPPAWPRHTLEWAVPTFLDELRRQRGTDPVSVGSVVDSFFDGDQGDPWKYIIDLVKDGLAARDLLERRPERVFRFHTGRITYEMPEATGQLAIEYAPERIERMFSAFETTRPEVWELLEWEVERAVAARLDTHSHHSEINVVFT